MGAAAAALAFGANVAFADSAPPPAWSWSGVYIGAHLGAGWLQNHWANADGIPAFQPFTTYSEIGGAVAGAQAGINFQSNNFVWGFELDASFADIAGTARCGRGRMICDNEVKGLGSATARFGYAFDRLLPYVKGGAAFAREEFQMGFSNGTPGRNYRANAWRTGWTAGAGLEYAFAGPWSAKIEYDFMRFNGDVTFNREEIPGPLGVEMKQDMHVIKLGLNHKIGGPGSSTDLTAMRATAAPAWNWTGLYVGAHFGTALGRMDWSDRTDSFGLAPFAFSNANRDIEGLIGGGQIGYNYQIGSWVLGVEGEASWAGLDGNAKCADFLTAACHTHVDFLGTLAGRVGYAFGNVLVYAKGGAAWAHSNYDINSFSFTTNMTASKTRTGWTAGGGVEYALSRQWSVKAEYGYLGFPHDTITFVEPGGQHPLGIDQRFHVLKVGVNRKLGVNGANDAYASTATTGGSGLLDGWSAEFGARYWLSSGRYQQDLYDERGQQIVSRLTYGDITGHSAETFVRFDHRSGAFVKGIFGAGNLMNGKLNDEDFPGGPRYSNTLSEIKDGQMRYASIDFGYNFFNDADAKFGPYIGYRYFYERSNGFGCRQIATSTVCAPALGTNLLALTETETWRGAAVGLNSQMMLSERLRLEVDTAYLPYLTRAGIDNHWFRPDINPGPEPGYGWGAAAAVGAGIAASGYYNNYGYYDPGYYNAEPATVEPAEAPDDAIAECSRRFRTYDPVSQTYIKSKGVRARCPQ